MQALRRALSGLPSVILELTKVIEAQKSDRDDLKRENETLKALLGAVIVVNAPIEGEFDPGQEVGAQVIVNMHDLAPFRRLELQVWTHFDPAIRSWEVTVVGDAGAWSELQTIRAHEGAVTLARGEEMPPPQEYKSSVVV